MADEEQVQEDIQQNAEELKDEPKEAVITEAMVKEFGVPDSMVGKPINELAKSYRSASKELTKRSQELSEMKKQLESKGEDVEIPDSLDYQDANEYKKAMRSAIKAETRAEMQEALAPLLEMQRQVAAQNVFTAIQKELPSDNAEEVAQAWMEDMGYGPEDGQKVFQGDVKRIIKSIVSWKKAKQLDEVKMNISKESGDKAIEAIKKSLKIQPRDSDLNSVSKQAVHKEDSIYSRIASNLEQENEFIE